MTSWQDYFEGIKKRLNKREEGFTKIFDYLEEQQQQSSQGPVIIETGTYREENNYEGDGCSTLLFDNFIEYYNGKLISIDIDSNACNLAKENTKHASIIESDSVEYLCRLTGKADLLYLDSFNIQNWMDDWEPASHHLKELFAAKNCIKNGTLIVVDDNIVNGKRMGKGRIIYELMECIGIQPFIDDYQVGWIWQE